MKKQNIVGKLLKDYGIVLVLILTVICFGIAKPKFLTVSNFLTILKQTAVVCICGVGMLFVLITGGINLAVGFMMSATGMICAICMVWWGWNPALAILGAFLIMMVIGVIIGMVIAYLHVAPFIVTMAFMNVLKGFSFLVTGGRNISGLPESFCWIGLGEVWFIPVPIILMALALFIGYFILKRMYAGRYFYAIGSNEEAARLSGINVPMVKIATYVISSFYATFAGIVMLGRIKTASPNTGNGYEFDVITACVLGGVSMTGGEGKVYQVLIGSLLIAVLNNGLIMMQVSEYIQIILKGIILLLAVIYDMVQKNQKKKVAISV
ncbi:MAG: ABC transporter permease [Eubacteriales bacterium]|nr:ABC transporter permease [Eubacteriales bacterium]